MDQDSYFSGSPFFFRFCSFVWLEGDPLLIFEGLLLGTPPFFIINFYQFLLINFY